MRIPVVGVAPMRAPTDPGSIYGVKRSDPCACQRTNEQVSNKDGSILEELATRWIHTFGKPGQQLLFQKLLSGKDEDAIKTNTDLVHPIQIQTRKLRPCFRQIPQLQTAAIYADCEYPPVGAKGQRNRAGRQRQ